MVMSAQKDNISQFNQYMKSDKILYIIYADLESLIKKNRRMCEQSKKIFNNKNWKKYSLRIFNFKDLGI